MIELVECVFFPVLLIYRRPATLLSNILFDLFLLFVTHLDDRKGNGD